MLGDGNRWMGAACAIMGGRPTTAGLSAAEVPRHPAPTMASACKMAVAYASTGIAVKTADSR